MPLIVKFCIWSSTDVWSKNWLEDMAFLCLIFRYSGTNSFYCYPSSYNLSCWARLTAFEVLIAKWLIFCLSSMAFGKQSNVNNSSPKRDSQPPILIGVTPWMMTEFLWSIWFQILWSAVTNLRRQAVVRFWVIASPFGLW